LNVWPRPSRHRAAGGLELSAWSAAARPSLEFTPAAIAFDIAGDRSSAAIAGAALTDRGVAVAVLEERPGVGWIAPAVRDLRRRWPGVAVAADSSVAAGVVADLARHRVTVEAIGATDHARACSAFVDALEAGGLVHAAQAALDDAVLAAVRRPLGDAWLWSRRRSGASIAPLVAVTLAAFKARTVRPAGRPTVVTVDPAAESARHVAPGSAKRPRRVPLGPRSARGN
jgi:hypothetical protein